MQQRLILDGLKDIFRQMLVAGGKPYAELRDRRACIEVPRRANTGLILGQERITPLRNAISELIDEVRMRTLDFGTTPLFAVAVQRCDDKSGPPFQLEVGRVEKLPDDERERKEYILALWRLDPAQTRLRDVSDALYTRWRMSATADFRVHPELLSERAADHMHLVHESRASKGTPPLEWIVRAVQDAQSTAPLPEHRVARRRPDLRQAAQAVLAVMQEGRRNGFGMRRVANMEGWPLRDGD